MGLRTALECSGMPMRPMLDHASRWPSGLFLVICFVNTMVSEPLSEVILCFSFFELIP